MQEHLAGGLDVDGILRDLVGNVLAEDHLVESDDGVDRRADLVAHAGEELVLRRVEVLDLVALRFFASLCADVEGAFVHDHHAHRKADQHERDDGIQMGIERVTLPYVFRVRHGDRIAASDYNGIADKEECPDAAVEDHADEHEVVEEPDRRTAVDAAVEEEDARYEYEYDQDRVHHGASFDVVGQDRTA